MAPLWHCHKRPRQPPNKAPKGKKQIMETQKTIAQTAVRLASQPIQFDPGQAIAVANTARQTAARVTIQPIPVHPGQAITVANAARQTAVRPTRRPIQFNSGQATAALNPSQTHPTNANCDQAAARTSQIQATASTSHGQHEPYRGQSIQNHRRHKPNHPSRNPGCHQNDPHPPPPQPFIQRFQPLNPVFSLSRYYVL